MTDSANLTPSEDLEADALPEELSQAVYGFFNRIPFNRLLGIEIDEVRRDCVAMSLAMRPDLVGNFTQGILHGGAISSLIDVCGGAMALIGAFDRHATSLSRNEWCACRSWALSTCVSIICVRGAENSLFVPQPCCARAIRSGWYARSCMPTTVP